MHSCAYGSVIYNSQYMKGTQVPINRQVDKNVVLHIGNGILLGHKKKEI